MSKTFNKAICKSNLRNMQKKLILVFKKTYPKYLEKIELGQTQAVKEIIYLGKTFGNSQICLRFRPELFYQTVQK